MLTPSQIFQFKNFGYLVVPEFTAIDYCESVIALARSDLKRQAMPIVGLVDRSSRADGIIGAATSL